MPSFLTLPSPQIAGGIIGTLSIVVWCQMFRRPSVPNHRITAFAALAFSGGFTGGTVVRANAHADFFRNLDNRTAFFQALDNIQTRLGEKPPDTQTNPTYPTFENESPELADTAIKSRGWEGGSPVNRSTLSRSANLPCASLRLSLSFCLHTSTLHVYLFLASTQTSQPKSRWEEIRAEHARNIATRSSWDELRQNASRLKGDTDQSKKSQDLAAERPAEQQNFDAMLEAEQRKAAEGNSWEPSI
jgi:hypothetical protein